MYTEFAVYDDNGEYWAISHDRNKYRIRADTPSEALRKLADRVEQDYEE